MTNISAVNAQSTDNWCNQSLNQLKQAGQTGETFFIKVHAVENLIYHQQQQGLQEQFLQLQKAAPDNVIGAARVLARLNKNNANAYQQYVNQILEQFKQGNTTHIKLTALESLGKLGYAQALPEIKAYADTGTHGFKAMARWILANNQQEQTENQLSEMLLSAEPLDYRYTAYALRFKVKANALTVQRLKTCLHTLKTNDAARVYVASSLFVHGHKADKELGKQVLFSYTTGDVGQRYEAAEGLGTGGSPADLPVLYKLLADENNDVRTAAANAILKLSNCKL